MKFIFENQYKANLHCHSTLSDGALTPEELKEAYKGMGYSILSITDHERPHDHSNMTEEDFLLLTGYEAYIRPGEGCRYNEYQPEIHINLLAKNPHNEEIIEFEDCCVKYVKDPAEKAAIKRYKGREGHRVYTAEYINEFISIAKEAGYMVTLNHPTWSLEQNEEVYKYDGYFSMEICNFSAWQTGLHEYNGTLYDMLLRQGKHIGAHSADDNHNRYPLYSPSTDSFGGFTMLWTKDGKLTYEGVIEALEEKNFYSSMGPVIHSVEVENGIAKIKCSPVDRISLCFGSKDPRMVWKDTEDGTITEAEFVIPETAPYIRFNIQDSHGRFADTRGYFRDEWENA